MKNTTETKMFQVVEQGDYRKAYMLMMTEQEMTRYLTCKYEMNFGKRKNGLDPNYTITAWVVNADGYNYIDLERIWKRYSLKKAV